MKDYFNKHKRGIIGTTFFHVIILIIVIIFGFTTPLPLPEEEGILINFGTDDVGEGFVEPKKSEIAHTVSKKTIAAQSQSKAEKEIVTQDIEESVSVENSIKKEKKIEKAEIKESEKKSQEQVVAKEEIEKKSEPEEKPREVNEQALFKGRSNNNSTQSEGNKKGTGNQGKPEGSINSKNREGSGQGDSGNKWSLNGRTLIGSLPKPIDTSQKEGIVVVEIKVDKAGNVTSANAGVKGSTTLDKHLCKVAKEAALKAKFNKNSNASYVQSGTITYHFVLE